MVMCVTANALPENRRSAPMVNIAAKTLLFRFINDSPPSGIVPGLYFAEAKGNRQE
jgi:hypothetical protein